jgi:hypothetical protein
MREMVTKELIKAKIETVQEEYLDALYKIVIAFGGDQSDLTDVSQNDQALRWHDFVQATFGCLADDPIKRGEQGEFEIRETLE